MFIRNHNLLLFILVLIFKYDFAFSEPLNCSYNTYKWNVKYKKVVELKRVQHSYASLSKYEVDANTGCSVCEEDQMLISVSGIKPFKLCRVLAKNIQKILRDLIQQGEVINIVIGYRVGKTRGEPDRDYNRTRFSNHSFGIALDINPQQNGLYDHCIKFDKNCRLIRGGPWKPDTPGSLTAQNNIVLQLNQLGLRWGGLIKGKQKDFMHFSPSGY